jgi:hypothetical protein
MPVPQDNFSKLTVPFSCPACTDPDRVIQEALEWAKTNP